MIIKLLIIFCHKYEYLKKLIFHRHLLKNGLNTSEPELTLSKTCLFSKKLTAHLFLASVPPATCWFWYQPLHTAVDPIRMTVGLSLE